MTLKVSSSRPVPPRIAYQHIPKCAGTSMVQALRECGLFAPEEVASLAAPPTRVVASLFGEDLHEFRERLLVYYLAHDDLRCVAGHFRLSRTAWCAFADSWHFITLLREPVSRWYSHYFYNRDKRRGERCQITADLEEFVQTDRAASIGTTLTYFFAGASASGEQSLVDQALSNLDGYALVGCLEHLGAFTARFRKAYGVELHLGKEKQSPLDRATQLAEITPEIDRRVRDLCAADTEMYRRVVEKHVKP